jgi:citrate lyase gamma subunit
MNENKIQFVGTGGTKNRKVTQPKNEQRINIGLTSEVENKILRQMVEKLSQQIKSVHEELHVKSCVWCANGKRRFDYSMDRCWPIEIKEAICD